MISVISTTPKFFLKFTLFMSSTVQITHSSWQHSFLLFIRIVDQVVPIEALLDNFDIGED